MDKSRRNTNIASTKGSSGTVANADLETVSTMLEKRPYLVRPQDFYQGRSFDKSLFLLREDKTGNRKGRNTFWKNYDMMYSKMQVSVFVS